VEDGYFAHAIPGAVDAGRHLIEMRGIGLITGESGSVELYTPKPQVNCTRRRPPSSASGIGAGCLFAREVFGEALSDVVNGIHQPAVHVASAESR
jgi:hypothetical protein